MAENWHMATGFVSPNWRHPSTLQHFIEGHAIFHMIWTSLTRRARKCHSCPGVSTCFYPCYQLYVFASITFKFADCWHMVRPAPSMCWLMDGFLFSCEYIWIVRMHIHIACLAAWIHGSRFHPQHWVWVSSEEPDHGSRFHPQHMPFLLRSSVGCWF